MSATMPDQRPHGKNDFDTLRWSVRSDGNAGFIFVNNYQRLQVMPPKRDVQFTINYLLAADISAKTGDYSIRRLPDLAFQF